MIKYFVISSVFFFGLMQPVSADDFESVLLEEDRWDKSTRIIEQTLFHFEDLKEIATYPYNHWGESWYYLAGLGALVLADKPITEFYQDKIEPIFKGHELRFSRNTPKDVVQWSGNVADTYLKLGMVGSYLLGVGINDESLQQAGLMAAKASVYSVLATHVVLKTVFARKRPVSNLSSGEGETRDYTTNPYAFGYFHRPSLGPIQYGTALPSFHFTEYFAVAKIYQKVYDNYLVPYSLITIGLTSSITGHRHWVSDMVAGALIGTVIGDVVSDHVLQGDKSSAMILPTVSNDEVGINLSYQF